MDLFKMLPGGLLRYAVRKGILEPIADRVDIKNRQRVKALIRHNIFTPNTEKIWEGQKSNRETEVNKAVQTICEVFIKFGLLSCDLEEIGIGVLEEGGIERIQRQLEFKSKQPTFDTSLLEDSLRMVLNDRVNSRLVDRVKAIGILMICDLLVESPDQSDPAKYYQAIIYKWKRLFKTFFNDKDQTFSAFCGEKARKQMSHVMKLSGNFIAQILLHFNPTDEKSCIQEAVSLFVQLIDKAIESSSKDSVVLMDGDPIYWYQSGTLLSGSYLRFRTAYHSTCRGIEIINYLDSFAQQLISLTFVRITKTVWAIDNLGRILSIQAIDHRYRKIVSDDKKWEKVVYDKRRRTVYAKETNGDYLSVFDAVTDRLKKDGAGELKIKLPNASCSFGVGPDGVLCAFDENAGMRYVRTFAGDAWAESNMLIPRQFLSPVVRVEFAIVDGRLFGVTKDSETIIVKQILLRGRNENAEWSFIPWPSSQQTGGYVCYFGFSFVFGDPEVCVMDSDKIFISAPCSSQQLFIELPSKKVVQLFPV